MRLRGEVVGALNLFRTDAGPFDAVGTLVAQALADVATIRACSNNAPPARHCPQRTAAERTEQPR